MSTSIDAKLASLTTILNTKAPPLKDDRGASYDPDVLAKLYSQILPNFNASSSTGTALQESVSDSTNIGFNSKEAAKLFGRTPTAIEMIVLDMARGLVSQDILDVNDLAKYKPTEVTEVVSGGEGSDTTQVVTKFIDPTTGKEFKPDKLGSTYTGRGGTGYRVSLDAEGKPTFSTEGFSTSDREQITKALALTAAIVFGGPLLGEALGAGAGATGATGAGAVGTGTGALTGTGLLGASEAAFVAADAAQLAAQGLSTSQITSTLAATGIPTTTASTLAQAATAAFGEAIASGVPANIAAMSAEVAAGNAAAGLSVTDAVAAGKAVGTGAAATGAAGAAGNIIGGGGAITAGTTGALTGANALAGTVAGSTAGTTLSGSTIANAATTAATALLGGGDNNLLGNIVGSGVNLAMVQDAANKLRQQGQISQEQYNNLSKQLQTQYTNLGLFGQKGLENVGKTAAGMVGNFTPYGVTNQLFGTRVNPETGAVETTLTNVGGALYIPFAKVAAQSAQAAEMTNVDQLAKDYYTKIAALSAPEIERQRLATEERLRAQGRLGVSGSAFGGSSPELLAQEQAIARQQLERELQSRQAALGERGTLIGQGNAAYSPISNLLGMQAQQQQLSGQLGQMAQQGRIAAAQLYAQPAAQGYTSALNVGAQGLGQMAQTERTGIASNLASQQAALDALAIGRTNVANNLLGPGGVNVGNIANAAGNAINAVTGLFNQPSNYVPGTNITYADALAQGLIAL